VRRFGQKEITAALPQARKMRVQIRNPAVFQQHAVEYVKAVIRVEHRRFIKAFAPFG